MAPPHLVFFHGKNLENQALFDVSGRKTEKKVAGLANRQVFKPTNLENWLILQATDNVFFRTINWIRFFAELIVVIDEIFHPPEKEVGRKKISPTQIRLCLWNPVTLQSIDLPVIEFEFGSKDRVNQVLITSNPDQPDCLILVFLNKSILFWDMDKRSDKCWTSVDYPDGFFELDGGFQQHKFALLKAINEIVVRTRNRSNHSGTVIEIKESLKRLVLRPTQLFRPHLPSMGAPSIGRKTYHVTCRGEFFLIAVCYGGVLRRKEDLVGDEVVSIVVFKLDSSLRVTHVLDTCPNASFFISGDQVLGFPTNKVDEGNRVYIVVENLLCTYHVENKTMSRSLLPSLPDCSTPPYWISGLPIASAPPLEKSDENRAFRETKNVVLGMMLIDHLPFDILKDISSHFTNPIDYLNFRASSKLCRSIAGSAKEWRSSKSISMSPLLMIPSVTNTGVSFMVDPVSGNRYNLNTCWGQEKSWTICSSSQGWLLMRTDFPVQGQLGQTEVNLRLYNPLTKSAISFQNLRHASTSSSLFAFVVTDSKVVELPLRRQVPSFGFIDLVRKESNRWNFGAIIRQDVDDINVNQSNINPACIKGGHFYFLVGDGDLASYVYDRDENSFTLSVLNLGLPCRGSFEQRFIVAGYEDNVVLSVYVGKEWEWLRVFGFDSSKEVMEWVEVEDLGNHNIYLSTVSCICKEVEFPAKGNRVYLPRFYGGRVVYYSLDTRKFHAGEGASSAVASYYESEEQLHMSGWLEPSLALGF